MNRVIKFQFLYKGLPFRAGSKEFNWHKKVYSLEQLMEKRIVDLSDVHNICELVAKRQFTGLTDKNGVDIYEGDILAFHVDWSGQPNKEVIFDVGFQSCVLLSSIEKEWVTKGSNHYKYWQTDEDNIYLLNQADSYDVEVIGNIHQNPELLK